MNTSTIHRQKHRRLVIRVTACLITTLFSIAYCPGQTKRDNSDYIIVQEVINTYSPSGSIIYLKESSNSPNHKLKEYYDYKFLGKELSVITAMQNDSLNYSSEKETASITKNFYTRYDVLNILFSQSDFEYILKNENYVKWCADKLKNVQIVKDSDINIQNIAVCSISLPIYSKDRKFAIVYFLSNGISGLFIFKNDNGIWKEVYKIKPF